MGSRSPAPGLAQQAPAHPDERRRADSAERAWRATCAGADLCPVGLVRRRAQGRLAMKRHPLLIAAAAAWATALTAQPHVTAQGGSSATAHQGVEFATSDNCLACHNGLTAPDGEDVS